MSLKFDVGNWKFELTLRELHCQPVKKESNTDRKLKLNERREQTDSLVALTANSLSARATPANQLTLNSKRSQAKRN